MTPLVFIVVLNWNGWCDTVQCLASLHALDYSRFEILVVDNASTDDSVRKIQDAFPLLKIIQTEKNIGFGGGCNIGIAHALMHNADWIWLINSDATVDTNCLSALVAAGLGDANLGAVGSVIYEAGTYDTVQLWGGGTVNLWLGRSTHRRDPGSLDFVSGASMLLRATALRHVGLFDERQFFMYWEDTDFGFRLRSAGYLLGVAADSRVWHKQSASLGKGNPLLDYYFIRSAVHFLHKHGPLPSATALLLAIVLGGKRLVNGQWRRFAAIATGYFSA